MSPDLDIKGIPFCDKHKDDILIAYWVLLSEGEKEFDKKGITYCAWCDGHT